MSFDRTYLRVEEVHIFDFDGTIFYSPSVDDATAALVFAQRLQTEDPTLTAEEIDVKSKSLVGTLSNPLSSGGLGWYQSLSSLTPPAVPAVPDEETWYVKPVVDRIRRLAPSTQQIVQENSFYERKTIMYVLTGRDVKYTHRIRELLRCVGVLNSVEFVFLKPTETAGTVRFKQNKILELIRRHEPRRVWYYDDRLEQGARIFAGLHELQGLLYAPAEAQRAWQSAKEERDDDATASGESIDTCALTAHTYSTVCVLDETVPLTGPSLLEASNSVVPRTAHVSLFTDLFRARSNRSKEAVKAIRAGRRWAADSIRFLNERFGAGRTAEPAALMVVAEEGKDALMVEQPCFHVPPPFHFTQVFMPDAIAEHSDHMLDALQVQRLIESLHNEKALFASRAPEERAPLTESPTSYRGRGGRGDFRGCGRGRGARDTDPRPEQTTAGQGVWAQRTGADYKKAFPSLPGM